MTDPVKKIGGAAAKMIGEKTKECFGTAGDLGDLVAGVASRDTEESDCAALALHEVLQWNDNYLYVPPSGISLIRNVYHRLPLWGKGDANISLIHLVRNLENPTDEAPLFLEEVLNSEDVELIGIECSAFRALRKFGRDSIPVLLRLLGNKFPWKITVVRRLVQIGLEKEDIRPLVEAMAKSPITLEHKDFSELNPQLRELGKAAREELLELYREGGTPVRIVALKVMVWVLEDTPDRFFPVALDSLKESDEELREVTIDLLSQYFEPEQLLPRIFDALDDPNDSLRRGLTKVMAEIARRFSAFGFPFPPEALIFHLTKKLEDANADVRQTAAKGLQSLGIMAKNSLPLLVAMKLNDPAEKCRTAAAFAIALIEEEAL